MSIANVRGGCQCVREYKKDATKNVSWKQFGIIAATTGLFAVAIGLMGIPPIAAAIALGSIVMIAMSFSLLLYGAALNKITKATKNINIKNIKDIAKSIRIFGRNIALLSLSSIAIGLGSIALDTMSSSLLAFAKSFKMIKDMGGIPINLVYQVLNAMKEIGKFFTKSALKRKAIKKARLYSELMIPFRSAVYNLSTLKKIGSIPMKLVFQTLNAMSLISDYYANNPIDKKAIKQSRRYRRMLKPFGKVIEYLAKLKEMGGVPTKLVENVVLSIGCISDFYSNMEISEEIEEKSAFSEFIVNKFTTMAKNIQDRFEKLKRVDFLAVGTIILSCRYITNFYSTTKFFVREKKIDRMNYAIEEFTNTAVFLKESIQGFTQDDYKSVKFAVKSMRSNRKIKKLLLALLTVSATLLPVSSSYAANF